MDSRLKKLNCALCHAYLFEDDDVVFCPVCGAPHHRECYAKIGHCALEQLHGTDEEYDSDKQQQKNEEAQLGEFKEFTPLGEEGKKSCGMCHERYDATLDACPKCATPNLEKFGKGFTGFDFLGGIPADYDIGEGVTADEAKRFVANNTPRYIQKFAKLSKMSKVSWNWLGFLFPSVWLLSRKMYRLGIIITAVFVAATLLTFPLSIAMDSISPVQQTEYANPLQYFYDMIPKIDSSVFIAAGIGLLVVLVIRIVFGMFGDYIYKRYTVKSIKQIKQTSEDKDADFRKKGGVSAIAMMIGLLVAEYLPVILISLM